MKLLLETADQPETQPSGRAKNCVNFSRISMKEVGEGYFGTAQVLSFLYL
jgi:hypothetical protein